MRQGHVMAERDAYSPRVAGTPRRPASALLDWNQMRLARRQEDAGVLFAATKVAGRALGSASKFLPRGW
jgi:hypothetical protein